MIIDRVESELDGWPTRTTVDVAESMTRLSRLVLLDALFDIEPGDEDTIGRDIAARRRYTEYMYNSPLPLRQYLPLPVVIRNRAASSRLRKTVRTQIKKARGRPRGHHLVSRLVHTGPEDKPGMPEELLRDEILTLTHTGYETVGDGLTWALYLVADHPECQKKLNAELGAVLGDRPPTASDLAKLTYTRSVILETLRLYPPTWIYTRVPQTGDRLPSGSAIPAGAKLYLCQWVMHRHPEHFRDPECFDPERFTSRALPPRYVYFPFGDGPHKCIGEQLAITEMMLVLASVGRRFWFTSPRTRPRPYAGVTLRPAGGLHLGIEAR